MNIVRKIFLEDWTMKVIALVITIALWLGVSGLRAQKTERLRSVSLNLRVSNEVEITNSPVKEVDIIVNGDDRKIAQINKEDLIVSLDLTDSQAGDRSVRITPENINVELPTGVRVVDIQPDKIAVKLERVEEREIQVKVETEGSVGEGFEIYGTTAIPQRVRVRAPESYVKTLDLISSEKIDVNGKTADFTVRQVTLNVLSPKIKLLDTIVDVIVRIGEKRVERLFLVPLKSEDGAKSAKIVLYGPRSVFENLHADRIQVEAVKGENGETTLTVSLPAEFQDEVEIREKKVVNRP